MKGIIMAKLKTTKLIVSYVFGYSASFVVGGIIANNVAPRNKLEQAEILVGSFVLGSIISDYARKYTDQQIDNAIVLWKKTKAKNHH
jgi:hypothetical protein